MSADERERLAAWHDAEAASCERCAENDELGGASAATIVEWEEDAKKHRRTAALLRAPVAPVASAEDVPGQFECAVLVERLRANAGTEGPCAEAANLIERLAARLARTEGG